MLDEGKGVSGKRNATIILSNLPYIYITNSHDAILLNESDALQLISVQPNEKTVSLSAEHTTSVATPELSFAKGSCQVGIKGKVLSLTGTD